MTQRFVVLLTASLLLCISLSGLAQDAKSAPDNPDPVAADQLYKAGKFAEAAEKYQALLKTDAKLVAAEAGLIEALLREQKIDEASAEAVNAPAAQPNSATRKATMRMAESSAAEMSEAE